MDKNKTWPIKVLIVATLGFAVASGAEDVIITVDGQLFPGEFPDEGPGTIW